MKYITQLTEEISNKTGVTKKDVKTIITSLFDVIKESALDGEGVTILNFGTFEVTELKERTVKNIKTKEDILVPASKKLKFKMSKTFKNDLNE